MIRRLPAQSSAGGRWLRGARRGRVRLGRSPRRQGVWAGDACCGITARSRGNASARGRGRGAICLEASCRDADPDSARPGPWSSLPRAARRGALVRPSGRPGRGCAGGASWRSCRAWVGCRSSRLREYLPTGSAPGRARRPPGSRPERQTSWCRRCKRRQGRRASRGRRGCSPPVRGPPAALRVGRASAAVAAARTPTKPASRARP